MCVQWAILKLGENSGHESFIFPTRREKGKSENVCRIYLKHTGNKIYVQ